MGWMVVAAVYEHTGTSDGLQYAPVDSVLVQLVLPGLGYGLCLLRCPGEDAYSVIWCFSDRLLRQLLVHTV